MGYGHKQSYSNKVQRSDCTANCKGYISTLNTYSGRVIIIYGYLLVFLNACKSAKFTIIRNTDYKAMQTINKNKNRFASLTKSINININDDLTC